MKREFIPYEHFIHSYDTHMHRHHHHILWPSHKPNNLQCNNIQSYRDGGLPEKHGASRWPPITTFICSLQAFCMTHKYVDNATMSEIVAKSITSNIQVYCDELAQQSERAQMYISSRKTNEMLIGSISKDPTPHLMLCGATVDRVTTFKLLGIHVSSDHKWAEYVNAIVSKAASRVHFLKQLKRAGVPIRDVLHFYTAIIRPVLEYACPVWH